MLKRLLRPLLPERLRDRYRETKMFLGRFRADWKLSSFRRDVWDLQTNALVRFLNFELAITDGPNFYMQFKDEFVRGIYRFEAHRNDPLIIDGGSNIGMSILAFKANYPSARIIAFEPDPSICRLLHENLVRNNISGVTVVEAGLGGEQGTMSFLPDASAGGQVSSTQQGIPVRIEVLSKYLNKPVDFLKLNIEGQELPVLREVERAGLLNNVREMVIEYHGFPESPQNLGEILGILDRAGFRYLLHDFDEETCRATKPPFLLERDTTWFCLIYAKQL